MKKLAWWEGSLANSSSLKSQIKFYKGYSNKWKAN